MRAEQIMFTYHTGKYKRGNKKQIMGIMLCI